MRRGDGSATAERCALCWWVATLLLLRRRRRAVALLSAVRMGVGLWRLAIRIVAADRRKVAPRAAHRTDRCGRAAAPNGALIWCLTTTIH